MSVTDEAVEANRRFARSFTRGELPRKPARRLAVLTCMDARLQAEAFLGLQIGDANVIRNAGGRASEDAIRSLIISSYLLSTNEFMVIHHTDCGMLGLDNDAMRTRLEQETGATASHIDFLAFSDLDQGVRDDVQRIRSSPHIPKTIAVTGFVFDVQTGTLRRIDV
jgi:carbonic anhydrase